jgi:hypothetical protein
MTIRVTVQNAANHGLSRREVATMLRHVPSSWARFVESVALYEHAEPAFRCTYFGKEKVLGLFWPNAEHGEQPTKAQAAEAMLIALSVVAERGALPERLSPSLREEHLNATAALRKKCLAEIGQHAT